MIKTIIGGIVGGAIFVGTIVALMYAAFYCTLGPNYPM